MPAEKPANAMVWFEIPVRDMEKARHFYNAVLQTELQDEENAPNPMANFPTSDMKSGLSGHLYPGNPAPEGTGGTIHLAAPIPLEETLRRVSEHGGRVVSPILTIPAGRFAYCLDPDGNSIGLFVR